ncbi:hypothetical protein AB4036_003242 [Escherichia coli]|nr:hypothetical protein [Escherichia coli]EGQ7487436.1 hypothetical protein [Escherichia coli]EGT1426071.1 hypothetical protein [Escherichia coli]EIT1030979.1 hypothetical protein [Escherichia coli]EJJ3113255.1 hypothetical protein [Escherichia coli]
MMKFIKKWWDNHDKSNNFLSGIHYIVISLAIIIGGAWSLYTFDALQMAKNAEIQLKKANEDLKQIKEQIKGTDSSSIAINVIPLKTQLGMIINVTIKNNGKRPLSFDTSKGALTVYKVSANGDKVEQSQSFTPNLYTSLRDKKHYPESKSKSLSKTHVLIGAEKTLSYIVGLNKPGVYYITFRSIPDDNFDTEELKNKKPVEWFASSYVEITPQKYK